MKCPFCNMTLLVQRTPVQYSVITVCPCVMPNTPTTETLRCTTCDIEEAPAWWQKQARDTRGLPVGDR